MNQPTFKLNLPVAFYQRLGVFPSERFALYWQPVGDELILSRLGGAEYPADFSVWLQLEQLNPEHDFNAYGSSEEDAKQLLVHVVVGTFTTMTRDLWHAMVGGSAVV